MRLSKCLSIVKLAIIILIITGCKKDNTNATLTPGASFTFTTASNAVLPCVVTFTDTSPNEANSSWDFGDGTTINNGGAAPKTFTHTYTAATPYTVTLTVTDNNGVKTTATKQITFSSTLITAVSGNYVLPNSVVTITGVNFSSGVTNNTVSINGLSATVNSATTTEITFTVPVNATSGNLVLVTNGLTITYPTTFFVASAKIGQIEAGTFVKHLNYAGPGSIVGTQNDSAFFVLSSISGYANQYVQSFSGYVKIVPNSVQLWGAVYTGGVYTSGNEYVAGTNTCTIYNASANSAVFAGSGAAGLADGQGTAAQFMAPRGMVMDAAGNIYVNDLHRIRKITPTGFVTTFAGSGADGNADGQGTAASFGTLYDIAIDAAGNLYVTDNEFLNVRKITAAGLVTTFAGSGTAGFADGTGKAAQFFSPKGIAADNLGNLYICDGQYNSTNGAYLGAIREISPAGIVTTILSSANGDQIGNPGGICWDSGFLEVCSTGTFGAPMPAFEVIFVAK